MPVWVYTCVSVTAPILSHARALAFVFAEGFGKPVFSNWLSGFARVIRGRPSDGPCICRSVQKKHRCSWRLDMACQRGRKMWTGIWCRVFCCCSALYAANRLCVPVCPRLPFSALIIITSTRWPVQFFAGWHRGQVIPQLSRSQCGILRKVQ